MPSTEAGGCEIQGWLDILNQAISVSKDLAIKCGIETESDEQWFAFSVSALGFCRAISAADASILLMNQLFLSEAKSLCRNVAECAIYLLAIEKDPKVAGRLKSDDIHSRKQRGKSLTQVSGVGEELRRELESFLAGLDENTRFVNVNALIKEFSIDFIGHIYKHMSATGAHLTLASLEAHNYASSEEGYIKINQHVAEDELEEVASFLCFCLLCCCELMRRYSSGWGMEGEFRALREIYVERNTRRLAKYSSIDR